MCDLWESDRDYRRLRIRGKTAENPHRKLSMSSHRASLSLFLPCSFLSLRIQSVWDGGNGLRTRERVSDVGSQTPIFPPLTFIPPSAYLSFFSRPHFPCFLPFFAMGCLLFIILPTFLPAFPLPKLFYLFSFFFTHGIPFCFSYSVLFIHVQERVLPNH